MRGNQYAYIKHQHQKKTNQEKLLGGTDKKRRRSFTAFVCLMMLFHFLGNIIYIYITTIQRMHAY